MYMQSLDVTGYFIYVTESMLGMRDALCGIFFLRICTCVCLCVLDAFEVYY